eukprot:764359-Hanusia_phi.AAC.3
MKSFKDVRLTCSIAFHHELQTPDFLPSKERLDSSFLSSSDTEKELTDEKNLNDDCGSPIEQSDSFTRISSLEKDCPSFLRLASHHNVLQQHDLDRCGPFALRRSSLVVGDLLGQGSSGE